MNGAARRLLQLLGVVYEVSHIASGEHPAAIRQFGAMHPDVPAVLGPHSVCACVRDMRCGVSFGENAPSWPGAKL